MTKTLSKKPSMTISLEKAYSLIKAPVLTEKSTLLTQDRQYVFEVTKAATKPAIKQAIEAIFKVKVESVNTLNRPGKEKRFRGRVGHTSGFKRAIVRLREGDIIDMGAGL
jgi:large subunit ribosomal protein L23